MEKKQHPLLRLAAFLLVFAAIVLFCNTHLLTTDTIATLTIREMQQRDDIDLAFIGSSLVRDHFNAPLISERLGMTAFNVAMPSASMPTFRVMTQELLDTNHPQWIVLVVEPYNFNTPREDPLTMYRMMPMVHGLKRRIDYFLDAVADDGYYIDRFFMFRGFMPKNPGDFIKTLGMRYDPFGTYEKIKDKLDPTATYQGSGFLRHESDVDVTPIVRQSVIRTEDLYGYYELMASSRDALLRYRDLCAENGVNLMVLISPNMTAHSLAEPDFLPYSKALQLFCRENAIECFNFYIAKRDFLPCLDEYYFDLYHMNGEGADIFSEAFCTFFKRYLAGEDVSDLFYESTWLYRDSIDWITNTWLVYNERTGLYTADCNTGYSTVPEYRFEMVAPDGTRMLLRDYDVEPTFSYATPADCQMRVYARPQGGEQDEKVYYDWPADYLAYQYALPDETEWMPE